MDKNKIEIKDLYLIFGSERNKAFKMLKKGKSKSELLKETGCTVAVNNASLSVREGEIFVIMGLSGSGKSSLLRCINRLNRPTSGEILINGEISPEFRMNGCVPCAGRSWRWFSSISG